jgi:hypothetical protein
MLPRRCSPKKCAREATLLTVTLAGQGVLIYFLRLHCARGAHRHSQLRAGRLTKLETQKEVSCSGF